ncbi:MAG TPA: hypothetical protein PLL20_01210 [Phycisphaerae bacterium]|nr:hypothetical protein [Phycisphaerae bacterium]
MGEFIIEIGQRRLALPNTFHKEGAEKLWRAAFLGQAVTFRAGLTGINIPWNPDHRPNYTRKTPAPATLKLDKETTWAHLQDFYANDGGAADYAADGAHKAIMQYETKPVTFIVSRLSNAVRVISDWLSWRNAVPWTTQGNPDTGTPGYWFKDSEYSPDSHGFPWNVPHGHPGRFLAEEEGRGEVTTDPLHGWDVKDEGKAWTPGQWVGYACWLGGGKFIVQSNTADTLHIHSAGGSYDGLSTFYSLRPNTAAHDQVEAFRWRGSTLEIGAVYIITDTTPPALVASAVLITGVRIHPGETLRLRYELRVRDYRSAIDT